MASDTVLRLVLNGIEIGACEKFGQSPDFSMNSEASSDVVSRARSKYGIILPQGGIVDRLDLEIFLDEATYKYQIDVVKKAIEYREDYCGEMVNVTLRQYTGSGDEDYSLGKCHCEAIVPRPSSAGTAGGTIFFSFISGANNMTTVSELVNGSFLAPEAVILGNSPSGMAQGWFGTGTLVQYDIGEYGMLIDGIQHIYQPIDVDENADEDDIIVLNAEVFVPLKEENYFDSDGAWQRNITTDQSSEHSVTLSIRSNADGIEYTEESYITASISPVVLRVGGIIGYDTMNSGLDQVRIIGGADSYFIVRRVWLSVERNY